MSKEQIEQQLLQAYDTDNLPLIEHLEAALSAVA